MDDPAEAARTDLQRAVERGEKLRADLSACEAEQQKIRTFLDMLQRYSGQHAAERIRSREPRARKGSKSAILVELCVAAIRHAGRPLSIVELVAEIHARGAEIGGAREGPNLAGYLSRSDRVRFERGIGWRAVRQRYPIDGAAPETSSGSPDAAPARPDHDQHREGDAGGGT